CDSEDARNAAGLQTDDRGGQQKGEREGEGEGDEKLAGKVQDQDGDREHEKGPNPGKLVASRKRHGTSRSLINGVACPGKNTSRRPMECTAMARGAEIERVWGRGRTPVGHRQVHPAGGSMGLTRLPDA